MTECRWKSAIFWRSMANKSIVYCSININTITMADAILFRIQGARNAAYPQWYVSNEKRRRQKKSFSPKGILSLVNLFLSLRSRTTEGTQRLLFVGIDSNLNIPLSWYLWNSTPSALIYKDGNNGWRGEDCSKVEMFKSSRLCFAVDPGTSGPSGTGGIEQ